MDRALVGQRVQQPRCRSRRYSARPSGAPFCASTGTVKYAPASSVPLSDTRRYSLLVSPSTNTSASPPRSAVPRPALKSSTKPFAVRTGLVVVDLVQHELRQCLWVFCGAAAERDRAVVVGLDAERAPEPRGRRAARARECGDRDRAGRPCGPVAPVAPRAPAGPAGPAGTGRSLRPLCARRAGRTGRAANVPLQRLLVAPAGRARRRDAEDAGGLVPARIDHVVGEDGVQARARDAGRRPRAQGGDRTEAQARRATSPLGFVPSSFLLVEAGRSRDSCGPPAA